MDSAEYSRKLLATVSNPPANDPVFTIDQEISHNAAHCMTSVICNRLANSDINPKREGGTTYRWDHGIVNIRNAVKPYLWTNLRLTVANDFHAEAAAIPAAYFMACWQPTDDRLHIWAIPEPVMFDALARHPVRATKEKRTIQIKIDVHRFEQCSDSPSLRSYYRALGLTSKELRMLKEAYDADSVVKVERKSGASPGATTREVLDDHAADSGEFPAGTSTSGPRYWAVTPGEQGRLWNECQEKGIIAIGWDSLGDLNEYPTQEAIADKLRSVREPGGPEPHMDSLACFQFARTMSPGDYVVAKIGTDKLLGIGQVLSEYRYDSSRTECRHVRQVRWRPAKNVLLPEGNRVAAKTLTEITKYNGLVDFVRKNLLLTEAFDTNFVMWKGF